MTKKNVYPSKTTLNLCISEKKPMRLSLLIPLVLAVLVVVALFAKFCVIDVMQKTSRTESDLDSLRSEQAELTRQLADYNDVSEEYKKYSIGWMNEDEKTLVKRTDMLDMIESMLMTRGDVQEITANGNILSVTVSGLTLSDMSELVEALNARDDIDNVVVSSASTSAENPSVPIVSMYIAMKTAEGGGR